MVKKLQEVPNDIRKNNIVKSHDLTGYFALNYTVAKIRADMLNTIFTYVSNAY